MELKDIKELIALMRKNDLSVFKLEQEGFKITLKRGNDFQPVIVSPQPTQPPVGPAPTPATPSDQPTGGGGASLVPSNLREITSPMVGTFYSAPAPEAPSYVSVGQEVTEDTTVCIIEAMKVMNEIKAEQRGVVVEILAENGKPVQFGQALFRVK